MFSLDLDTVIPHHDDISTVLNAEIGRFLLDFDCVTDSSLATVDYFLIIGQNFNEVWNQVTGTKLKQEGSTCNQLPLIRTFFPGVDSFYAISCLNLHSITLICEPSF